jgi:hypothetical protein
VKHSQFVDLGIEGLKAYLQKDGVFYDIKEAL